MNIARGKKMQEKINEALASLARIEEKVNIIGEFLETSIRIAKEESEAKK